MRKYLPSLILGTAALIAVAALFIFLDRQPKRTVGDGEGEKNVLAMELSPDGSFYTVTGLGKNAGGDIEIPSEFDGVPVKEIGLRAFRGERSVTSVIIPDTVVAIREAAFRGCPIEKLIIPDSVKIIEGYAFADCEKLISARLPEAVESLGKSVFSGCEALREVTLPKNLTEIPAEAFARCTALTYVEIPGGVEYIGDDAFTHSGLEKIVLPESLKEIGGKAFQSTRLTSAELPDGLEKIGYCAFMGCPISEIDLPEGIREIGCKAFSRTLLESVYIPASVERLDGDGFGESGGSPFSYCESLVRVEIDPENPVYYSQNNCIISRVGELLFMISPEDVPSDGSVKAVAPFAYRGISADRVVIPEGVSEIKEYGLNDYEYIREIVLPSTLKKLGFWSVSASGASNEPAERISFAGTVSQWREMERDENWLLNSDKVLILDLID